VPLFLSGTLSTNSLNFSGLISDKCGLASLSKLDFLTRVGFNVFDKDTELGLGTFSLYSNNLIILDFEPLRDQVNSAIYVIIIYYQFDDATGVSRVQLNQIAPASTLEELFNRVNDKVIMKFFLIYDKDNLTMHYLQKKRLPCVQDSVFPSNLEIYSTISLASLSLPQLKDAAAEEDLFGDMVTDEWIEVLSRSILRVDIFLLW
jgi:hypothetical protein